MHYPNWTLNALRDFGNKGCVIFPQFLYCPSQVVTVCMSKAKYALSDTTIFRIAQNVNFKYLLLLYPQDKWRKAFWLYMHWRSMNFEKDHLCEHVEIEGYGLWKSMNWELWHTLQKQPVQTSSHTKKICYSYMSESLGIYPDCNQAL